MKRIGQVMDVSAIEVKYYYYYYYYYYYKNEWFKITFTASSRK